MSNSDPEAELKIVGTHDFRFIPPRRVVFVMRGVFEEEHALAYTEFLAKHAERCGEPLEGLLDLSALTSITPSARTRIVKRDRAVAYCRLAIVGASFSIQTVSSMMINAGKIVTPSRFAFDTKFFGTVEEANAWFDASRAKPV